MYALTNIKPLLIPPILCSCVTVLGKEKPGSGCDMPGWAVMHVNFDL